MAHPVLDWRVAVQKAHLQPTTKHVLLNMSIYMNAYGENAVVSLERMSADTGLTKRSLISHIDKAVEAGFLYKSKVRYPGSKWIHSEYKACFPDGTELQTKQVLAKSDANITGELNSPVEDLPGELKTGQLVKEVHTSLVKSLDIDIEKKNIKKKSQKLVLADWEKEHGVLCIGHMKTWVRDNQLDPDKISTLIEQFRLRMQANATQYANFSAGFKDWLNRGFLTMKIEDCRVRTSGAVQRTYGAGV